MAGDLCTARTTGDALAGLIAARDDGTAAAITSVCSAHPLVLEATMHEASTHPGPVLIEATSNQVNQDGGYTGMRPRDFYRLVLELASRHDVAPGRIILGGDHLGPNPWRALPAEAAMTRAEQLVAAYAAAGATKIHLDCSMPCADDRGSPDDKTVSARTTRLLSVAERAATDPESLSYVIGTEVPTPGGAAATIDELRPTSASAARATLAAHAGALADGGLDHVWPRVRALVVQPGVEFDEWRVIDYAPAATGHLRGVLDDVPGMVFEAHSTDYQSPAALAALARDGWAILKVGPWLSFAMREAMFALEAIESELIARARRSGLADALEAAMLAQPQWWAGHHPGDESAQRLARRYSYSDRARYYWTAPAVQSALEQLLSNLAPRALPEPLIAQFLPAQYTRVRAGEVSPHARELLIDHIADVLRAYRHAGTPPAAPQREREQARSEGGRAGLTTEV